MLVRASGGRGGGLLFYGLIVRPLWGLVFQFASTPARALEGSVAGVAEALTRFDASGKGLVRLTVDGQLVRVLAYLESDERGQARLVKPGDTLTVSVSTATPTPAASRGSDRAAPARRRHSGKEKTNGLIPIILESWSWSS